MPDTDTHTLPPKAASDPADVAMCGRARERYTADRSSARRRRRKRHAELPNLIIIGGLKCGTTSIHHYLGLHPEIQMSKPKELNFFVEELNWDLGLDWYASRFDDRFKVRGESSPHYTNLPRFDGVAEGLIRLLLLTGHRLSAAEALRAGIVDEVVPLSQLADCARALADELAAKPRAALIRTKAAILAASPPGAWLAGPGSQPEPATEQQQKEPAQSHEGVRV